MAVKMKRNTTAGPPSKAALPIVEKIPAPMIAATPNAVRSHTPSVRLSLTVPPSVNRISRGENLLEGLGAEQCGIEPNCSCINL